MADQQDNSTGVAGVSKPALSLLIVALALAAVSIAFNVRGAAGQDDAEGAASSAPPTIEQLRDKAESSPDDALPWQELGFAYFQRGEFDDAASAYERAVAAEDKRAVLWSALGEAKVMASEREPMPADALEAFQKAISLDPKEPRARYFLAVRKDLDGDHAGAIEDWLALLKDTPPGAPWEGDLVRTIEQIGQINNIDVQTRLAAVIDERGPAPAFQAPGLPGPTDQQIAAAGSMSPGEQRGMAVGMVERLEQRLASEPSNLDGWVMLMRSRVNLGENDRAKDALDRAIAANPSAESGLRRQAEQLGIR
jgi:cytochrome c-type biogenesis protein CcmH